jgi:hypothetical protein
MLKPLWRLLENMSELYEVILVDEKSIDEQVNVFIDSFDIEIDKK